MPLNTKVSGVTTVPKRIVSLAPYITDIVARFFGEGDRIVAATDLCVVPASHTPCVRVGGSHTPCIKDILETKPDIILVPSDMISDESMRALTRAEIRIVRCRAEDLGEASKLVMELGALLQKEREARDHVAEAEKTVAAVQKQRRKRNRPRVLCLVWNDPLHALVDGTYAGDLIDLAGGENIIPSNGHASVLMDPSILKRDPEVILLPNHVFSEKSLDKIFFELGCSATLDGRVHLFSGQNLFWPGPRAVAALPALSQIFYL